MKDKNCPNCGAPFEPYKNTCEYCGTSYFDMTSINFNEHKPVYLKCKINGMVITQLVVPKLDSIEYTNEPVYVYGGKGSVALSVYNNPSVITNINFKSIVDNGAYMKVEVVNDDLFK